MDIRLKARIILFVTLCAVFFPLQMNASAQAEVIITARAGLRGSCKSDKWLPVHITVENKGADVNARVRAEYKSSAGGQIATEMEVSLPATSRKEFFLYIMPEAFMRGFTVSVLDEESKTLAKINLNIACSTIESALFGVLADTPSNFSALNNVRPLSGTVKTVQLQISDLPDQAQGWDMLDALIVSNIDTGTMTSEQKQALELWLAGGGKLFVTGGIQWQSTTAGLGNLLPIQPSATRNVSALTSLSEYAMDLENPLEVETILATGKLQARANILVEQDGIPVLAEKEIGYGKTYYFAPDPGLSPLNDWDGMEDIYGHLLGFKSPIPTWGNGVRDIYYANTALSTLPELSLPSFVYICGWLGLYIIIIGPVNYFVLRRLKRTELAWVTIPALVIVFTSLAYFSGYAYRGTKPILNRIMIMQGWQGVEKGRVEAMVGVYSPVRTAYDVETQEQFLVSRFALDNGTFQEGSDWSSIKTNEGTVLPDMRVEIGGVKSLGAKGYLPAPSVEHSLKIKLSENTPTLEGVISNTNGYTLEDVVLVTPTGWETLGDIAPGESKKVRYVLSSNSAIANSSAYNLVTQLGMDPYTNDDLVAKRRTALFQSISDVYGRINVTSGIYLMAWVEDKVPTPVSLKDKEAGTTDTLLYFRELTPSLESGQGTITLTSGVYQWESSRGNVLLTNSSDIGSDGYSLRFQPGVPVKFGRVVSLSLSIATNASVPYAPSISLWDYQARLWQPFTPNAYGAVEVTNPEQYVGMDGEIMLNLQGDPNIYFDITSIDFTLKVHP